MGFILQFSPIGWFPHNTKDNSKDRSYSISNDGGGSLEVAVLRVLKGFWWNLCCNPSVNLQIDLIFCYLSGNVTLNQLVSYQIVVYQVKSDCMTLLLWELNGLTRSYVELAIMNTSPEFLFWSQWPQKRTRKGNRLFHQLAKSRLVTGITKRVSRLINPNSRFAGYFLSIDR